ncbi:MAG: leucine-rich repeat protein [Clostridia bacterium]|nr:leucine-rich repeat protein [Clostridia bacterium]
MKKNFKENIVLITILLLVLGLGISSVSAFSTPGAQSVSTTRKRLTTIPIGNLTYNGFRYKIIDEEAAITARSSVTGDITIPNEIEGYPVTSIMHSAFRNCTELTSITIPETVKSIGDGVFSGASSLEKIIVDSKNPCFSNDEQGVLFNKDKTELIHYPSGKSNNKYAIPDTVVTIADTAFDDCDKLTHITIGKSVKNLDTDYFRKTNNLEVITVSNENEHFSSDSCGILFNREKTKLLFCPKQNKETEYEIPETVLSVSDKAFYENQNLVFLIISDSVVDIGTEAFRCCDELTKVIIGNSVNKISRHAFYDCCNLKEAIIGNSVKSIDENAFSGCESLLSIAIPSSVEGIGTYAFSECTNINEFTVSPDNKFYSNDEYGVLFNKEKTELIQFPYGCSLTEYYIPDSVITVYNTLGNCEHITIGKSVNNENSSLWQSKTIKTITVSDENNYFSNDEYGVLFNKNKSEILKFPCENSNTKYPIPNGVTAIGVNAFSGCCNLENVIIPNSVTNIKSGAFSDCYNITDVKLPTNLLSIGNYAFDSCDSMKKITIPKSVTNIGEFAFGFTNTSFTRGGIAEGANKIIGFKMYCFADSAGLEYAITYGVDYEIITSSVEFLNLSQNQANITYKTSFKLSATLSEDSDESILWESSNPEVATVDENGNITAVGSGTTTITATIEGTDISDSCEITVSYAWWQWLIRIFLLGFLWY